VEANGFSVKNCIIKDKNIGLEALGAGAGFNVGSNAFDGNTHPLYTGRDFSIDDSTVLQDSRGSNKNTYQAIEFGSGSIDTSIT
jgi:hypothetical protein